MIRPLLFAALPPSLAGLDVKEVRKPWEDVIQACANILLEAAELNAKEP